MKISKKVNRSDKYLNWTDFFLFTSLFLAFFAWFFLDINPLHNKPFISSFIAACYFLLLFEVTTK